RLDHLLHPRLRPLEAGAVRAGPEHEAAGGPELVGQARHQRRLGAHDVEVGVDRLGRRRGRAGDARVPGGDDHLGGAGEHVGERVLAPARSDDTDLHGTGPQGLRWTYWSRPGPTPTRWMGTPTWSSRKAT